mgnify:CR=1 FL=1
MSEHRIPLLKSGIEAAFEAFGEVSDDVKTNGLLILKLMAAIQAYLRVQNAQASAAPDSAVLAPIPDDTMPTP